MQFFTNLIPQCRLCTTDAAIQAFQQNFRHYADNPVEEDYLRDERSHTVGVYWLGRMIGGYVLREGPELRYRNILAKAGGAWPESPDPGECVELCCSWLAQRHTLLSLLMFSDSARRLRALPQPYLVAGSRIPAVAAAHRVFFPHNLCSTTWETQGRIERWSFYYSESAEFTPAAVFREALRRLCNIPRKRLPVRLQAGSQRNH